MYTFMLILFIQYVTINTLYCNYETVRYVVIM
jgi:hypothetical protein